jgi:hypothetical protein
MPTRLAPLRAPRHIDHDAVATCPDLTLFNERYEQTVDGGKRATRTVLYGCLPSMFSAGGAQELTIRGWRRPREWLSFQAADGVVQPIVWWQLIDASRIINPFEGETRLAKVTFDGRLRKEVQVSGNVFAEEAARR